jgi:hypothetical protein
MKIYKSYFLIRCLTETRFHIFCSALFLFLFNNQVFAQTDYADLKNWAAHPWKSDMSDSVPKPLQAKFIKDSVTDVFFIYPTSYTSKNFTEWNASIDDQAINDKTDRTSILYQASAFNESSRVFAPRYRQANLEAFFIDTTAARPYFDTAYADVKNAFIYYLEHLNQGRPIIIASHSQGTVHAARLLKEFFEGKMLMNKLICAYIIGMPVPENYFSQLKVCDQPSATGCFVSWRTYKKGYEPAFIKKENFKAVVVNPLTWTTSDSLAASSLNKGGVLKNFNKIVPAVVNAQVHGNMLWSCKPNVPGRLFFTRKNFHIGDINLFYLNIRENVKNRIAAFWKK